MDIRYLIQILLFFLFLIGTYCVLLQRQKRTYDFLHVILKEECPFTYRIFSKYIEQKKICAFEKYEIWRYIEHRRASSFI